MTRILTIIALMFATPAWADECFSNKTKRKKPIFTCDGSDCYERSLEHRELAAKADKIAKSEGWKNSQEKFDAEFICLLIRYNPKCDEQYEKYKCHLFPISENPSLYRAPVTSYEKLQNRVEELEAEVEQLRNR
jgi:hypothetical protein